MNVPLFLVALLVGALEVVQAASDEAVVAANGIRRIAVLGERHSGTNFMARLLATNLDPRAYVYGDHFCQNGCGTMSDRSACISRGRAPLTVLPHYMESYAMHFL